MRVIAAIVSVVSALVFFLPAAAKAAAVRAPILACRDQADIKRALRPASDKERKDDAAHLKSKVASGDCLQLVRDQKVLVDQRDGVLWCVRPSGGLDCFWTYEKAIDPYPPPPAEPGDKRKR
jgi:hypothetical protein